MVRRDKVIILINNNSEEETCGSQVASYFQRPSIYYYFAIPLMAPAFLLLVVASIPQSSLETVFVVYGSLLVILCVISFSVGTLLGIRNKMKLRKYRDQLALLEQGKAETSSTHSVSVARNADTPSTLSTSMPSTASSSRRSSSNSSLTSLGSHSSPVGILSTTDKSKLFNLKKKSMRRKRGVKFPVDKLPSLIEEDSFVKTVTRRNSVSKRALENLCKSAGPASTRLTDAPSAGNLDELKEYLTAIGLGGGGDVPRPAAYPVMLHKRSKSFDEKEFKRQEAEQQPGHVSLQPQTQSFRSKRRKSVSETDAPVIVSVSHERTGVRLPDMR